MRVYIPHTEVGSGVYLYICFCANQKCNFPHSSSQPRLGLSSDAKVVGNNPPTLHNHLTESGTLLNPSPSSDLETGCVSKKRS